MAEIILDTNIVSYFLREHSLAKQYRTMIENHVPSVSFMTVAELYEGGYRARWNDERWDELEITLLR